MPSKKTTKSSPKKSKKLTPTEKLKNTIEQLEISLNESSEKHLRLKAEFDNFRKRKDKEIVSLLNYEGESVIKQFLSVLDDLGRLSEATSKNGDEFKSKYLICSTNLLLHKRSLKILGIDDVPLRKAIPKNNDKKIDSLLKFLDQQSFIPRLTFLQFQ